MLNWGDRKLLQETNVLRVSSVSIKQTNNQQCLKNNFLSLYCMDGHSGSHAINVFIQKNYLGKLLCTLKVNSLFFFFY